MYQKTKCKWGRKHQCQLTTGYSHMRRNIRKSSLSAKEDGLNELRSPTNFPTGHHRQLMLTNIVSSHYSRSWKRGGYNTHPGLTDSGDGGFLQIFYHCHQHLVTCDLSKMYPGNRGWQWCIAALFLETSQSPSPKPLYVLDILFFF